MANVREIPKDFLCALSKEIMSDPVMFVYADGTSSSTYDRENIVKFWQTQLETWAYEHFNHFSNFAFTDPLTGTKFTSFKLRADGRPELPPLISNTALKGAISSFKEAEAKAAEIANTPAEKIKKDLEELQALRIEQKRHEAEKSNLQGQLAALRNRVTNAEQAAQNAQNQAREDNLAAQLRAIEELEARELEQFQRRQEAMERRLREEHERLVREQKEQEQNLATAKQRLQEVRAAFMAEEKIGAEHPLDLAITKLESLLSLNFPATSKNIILLETNSLLAQAYLLKKQVGNAKKPLERAVRLLNSTTPSYAPFEPQALCIARLEVLKVEISLYETLLVTQDMIDSLERAISIFSYFKSECLAELKNAHVLLGIAYLKDKKYAQSEEQFNAAASLDSKPHALLLAGLGEIRRLHDKNNDLAKKNYAAALAEYDKNTRGNALAYALAANGLYTMDYLQKPAADAPAPTEHETSMILLNFTRLIHFYFNTDNDADIGQYIGTHCLNNNFPLLAWAHVVRGNTYYVQNNYKEAWLDYEYVFKNMGNYCGPGDKERVATYPLILQDAFALRARMMAEMPEIFEDKAAQCEARLTTALEYADVLLAAKLVEPSTTALTDAETARAAVLLQKGKLTEALPIYDKLITQGSRRHYGRAEVHFAMKHIDLSIQDCLQVLSYPLKETHRYKVSARNTICKIAKHWLTTNEDPKKAIALLETAKYATWPRTPTTQQSYEDALCYLVIAHAQAKEIEQAIAVYTTLNSITPSKASANGVMREQVHQYMTIK